MDRARASGTTAAVVAVVGVALAAGAGARLGADSAAAAEQTSAFGRIDVAPVAVLALGVALVVAAVTVVLVTLVDRELGALPVEDTAEGASVDAAHAATPDATADGDAVHADDVRTEADPRTVPDAPRTGGAPGDAGGSGAPAVVPSAPVPHHAAAGPHRPARQGRPRWLERPVPVVVTRAATPTDSPDPVRPDVSARPRAGTVERFPGSAVARPDEAAAVPAPVGDVRRAS